MNSLTFHTKKSVSERVDLSPLLPEKLSGKSLQDIRNIKLTGMGRKIPVHELFTVSGSNKNVVTFKHSSKLFRRIGYNMSKGRIIVHGHAGDYLGSRMSGGTITVKGHTGDWVASAMSGGMIEISGNAGDYVAAASPDEPYGLIDGLITIWGNAGDRTGDRMRRGQIFIYGDAGDYLGSRMVAGTILALGKTGKYPGFGMKRGSIILGQAPEALPSSFRSCGRLKLEYLRILFTQLPKMGPRFSFFRKYGPEAYRYAGDLSLNGKGEIFILQNT